MQLVHVWVGIICWLVACVEWMYLFGTMQGLKKSNWNIQLIQKYIQDVRIFWPIFLLALTLSVYFFTISIEIWY